MNIAEKIRNFTTEFEWTWTVFEQHWHLKIEVICMDATRLIDATKLDHADKACQMKLERVMWQLMINQRHVQFTYIWTYVYLLASMTLYLSGVWIKMT